MLKNDLILALENMPGNPEVYTWSMDFLTDMFEKSSSPRFATEKDVNSPLAGSIQVGDIII